MKHRAGLSVHLPGHSFSCPLYLFSILLDDTWFKHPPMKSGFSLVSSLFLDILRMISQLKKSENYQIIKTNCSQDSFSSRILETGNGFQMFK